jgi:hypothetical protein
VVTFPPVRLRAMEVWYRWVGTGVIQPEPGCQIRAGGRCLPVSGQNLRAARH